MRFSLILEDEQGDKIDLTTSENKYMVSEIDGLYPLAGTVNTSSYAGTNGSYLNTLILSITLDTIYEKNLVCRVKRQQ